jgi:hypothetical protein
MSKHLNEVNWHEAHEHQWQAALHFISKSSTYRSFGPRQNTPCNASDKAGHQKLKRKRQMFCILPFPDSPGCNISFSFFF